MVWFCRQMTILLQYEKRLWHFKQITNIETSFSFQNKAMNQVPNINKVILKLRLTLLA